MSKPVEALHELMNERTSLVLQITEYNAEVLKLTQSISGFEVHQLHKQNQLNQQNLSEDTNLKEIEEELLEMREQLICTEEKIKLKQNEIAAIDKIITKLNQQ